MIDDISKSEEGIVFYNIPHRDQTLDCIELCLEPFDSLELSPYYSSSETAPKQDGWTMPDSELTFQLLRRISDRPADEQIAKDARTALRDIFSKGILTATRSRIDKGDAFRDYILSSESPITGKYETTASNNQLYQILFGKGHENDQDILTLFCPEKPRKFFDFLRRPTPVHRELNVDMQRQLWDGDAELIYDVPVYFRSRGDTFEVSATGHIVGDYPGSKTLGVRTYKK